VEQPTRHTGNGFRGPACWFVSALSGLVGGALLVWLVPSSWSGDTPAIPWWLCTPFALLLAGIALMPFVHQPFWHRHYPDFAFFLAGLVAAYYLLAFNHPLAGATLTYGQEKILHAALEYYAFIALVGGLFVVSGGIHIEFRGHATPLVNTALLALGSVLANIVGTTGASMLLIRPFMRINRGRLRPTHVVFFIFIISNCAGCLTPIGDPPLYLGYLSGVPFLWTLTHMWQEWAFVIALLLAVFFAFDVFGGRAPISALPPAPPPDHPHRPVAPRLGLKVRGRSGMIFLALIIGGVFIDPLLKHYLGIEGIPVGATFQIAMAIAAWLLAPRQIHAENAFTFGPAQEVALLFAGIFLTMAPALGYLSAHGPSLGPHAPTSFYFGTGLLSAVLDNAPTYLNFLQIAFGPTEITPDNVGAFLAKPGGALTLKAISTGAVFFGAMTYIGNGPNFMVKAIAESAGVRMPSFFGYLLRAVVLLLPVLVAHWLLFIR
jgi:Na+/H+ antiporter NhaD/arsenite permease-like protein